MDETYQQSEKRHAQDGWDQSGTASPYDFKCITSATQPHDVTCWRCGRAQEAK